MKTIKKTLSIVVLFGILFTTIFVSSNKEHRLSSIIECMAFEEKENERLL